MWKQQRRPTPEEQAADAAAMHATASALAGSVFDRTPTGARVPVWDVIAIEALQCAFLAMLEGGKEGHAILIDAATAAAFPRSVTPPDGSDTYLAVATNDEGRVVFTIHSVSRAERRLLALP